MQETQETWVQSLGEDDPLEEEMATHSSTLAWRIPWPVEPGSYNGVIVQVFGEGSKGWNKKILSL